MVEKEIERNDWGRFLEEFTLAHDQWLVSVDDEGEALPLEGLIARDDKIVIHLGRDIRHHRSITVDAASIRVRQADGVDVGLAVAGRDGRVTRLTFRSPMPPELVDGIP